ncbi:unnamed protein product [Adineta ricciae]|uniref:Nuclear receptor domain-containing protein n=1 Tax=Adineta ricciae TaxID=249248 RepID=A0A814LXF3_ADIRI|nr:unnamed protein product [Adineta ricciae]CAF1507684.1 unnamed protein product [Adineta ricciae]
MTTQTKVMIVTADDNFIRLISSNKQLNTTVVNLDKNNQSTSTNNPNTSIIDLVILAQLFNKNSTCDHTNKRTLDSSQGNQAKVVKTSEKNNDLVCSVCGDHAVGFNYGAMTCASCKVFFRRNALQPPEKIRCFNGQNACLFSHGTHRRCQKCRLRQCFAVGMKKYYFVTSEEKERRRKQLEENLNQTRACKSSILHMPDDIDLFLSDINNPRTISPPTLHINDWQVIQTIEESYALAFQSPLPSCPGHFPDRESILTFYRQTKDQMILQFINFLRQIKEFEALNEDDRFILIKYNLNIIGALNKFIYFDNQAYTLCDFPSMDQNVYKYIQTLYNVDQSLQDDFINLVGSFLAVIEQDLLLLRLLIVTLLFSKGLSLSDDEPPLRDPLAAYRADSYYTQLIWNYLLDKQGEQKAIKQFTYLISIIFKLQIMIKKWRDHVREELTARNKVDLLTPLMQAVLHIA